MSGTMRPGVLHPSVPKDRCGEQPIMRKTQLFNGSLLLGLLLAPSLSAATIPKLYNTGVSDSKALLPDATVDPHYKITVSADATLTGPDALTLNPGDISPWLPEGPDSRWIAPSAAGRSTGAFEVR